MAATILNSARATEVSVYVVRAFIQLSEILASHRDLGRKLKEPEQKSAALALRHDNLAQPTRQQLRQVFDALRELMAPPQPANKRPIGFVTPDDEPAKSKPAGKHA